MNTSKPNEALVALLHAIPAQPIDTRNPLVTLRPLFAGTMTFDEALAPAVQEAMELCEQVAWNSNHPGRSLCQRLIALQPSASATLVAGW